MESKYFFFAIIPILILGIHSANADIQIDPASVYLNNNGNYVPYVLTQNSTDITINSMEGSYVFDKNSCSISFYNGTDTNHKPVIGSDTYSVLASQGNSGVWNPVSLINSAQCTPTVTENAGTVTITGTKSVSGAGVFSINYTKAPLRPLKLSFSATNNNPAWTNYHIGMAETIQVPRNIKLGNQTYNLSLYNNTVLNRNWISSHSAQLIQLGHSHFDMGLGWNNVNQVTITFINGLAYLKIDYTFNTPILSPGNTITVDPSIAIDTISVKQTVGGTVVTSSVTIGTHPARVLIVPVFTAQQPGTPKNITSVTFNGVQLTNYTLGYASTPGVNNIRTYLFYMTAPTTGTHTLTATFCCSGETVVGMAWYSLYNVDQTTPLVHGNATAANSATIGRLNITPTNIGSWIFANEFANNLAGPVFSDTMAYSDATGIFAYGEYNSSPTIGVKHIFTFGATAPSVEYAMNGAEIKLSPNTPSAPTLTHANTLNTTAIKLDWTSSVNATYYLVNRTTSLAGTYTQIKNTTLTTFTDTGLAPGAFYTYVVHAGNHTGISGPSNVRSNNTNNSPFAFRAFHRDNTTAVYGQGIQSNTTFTNNRETLVSGLATFNGIRNLNNFTGWNSLINFIVGKQYNYNTTLNHSLNMSTNDYDVDCPSTGTGIDVEVWTNGTNGHRITTFTTPTCFANNTMKWSTKFTANGNDVNSYNTVVYVRAVNATFGTAAPLKFNTTKVTTTFGDPYILSSAVSVGTGLQTKLFNWSMNLTVSPAFTPVNFTVGHISVSGVNPVTAPIKFTTTTINSSATKVTVTFPSTYTMGYQLNFGNEGSSHTYTGLPVTSPSLGLSQSSFTFLNPKNDMVTIKAYDIPTNTTARYILAQPNNQIPFVTQILNFKNGLFGTSAMIGGIDIVSLIILLIAMIGLNRANEVVGAIMMIVIIGVAAYFGLIQWQTTMTAAIALVILVIVSTSKKLPFS